jgi:uncharacterized protein YacL
MRLLQNIIALIIFFCLAAALIYVGVYILLAILIVTAIAFAWYGVKFWFLRREIQSVMREHQGTSFSDAMRRRKEEQDEGPVIDGEFEEIDEKDKR